MTTIVPKSLEATPEVEPKPIASGEHRDYPRSSEGINFEVGKVAIDRVIHEGNNNLAHDNRGPLANSDPVNRVMGLIRRGK